MKTIEQFSPGEMLTGRRQFLGFLVDNNGNKCGVVIKVSHHIPGSPFSKSVIDVITINHANLLIDSKVEEAQK